MILLAESLTITVTSPRRFSISATTSCNSKSKRFVQSTNTESGHVSFSLASKIHCWLHQNSSLSTSPWANWGAQEHLLCKGTAFVSGALSEPRHKFWTSGWSLANCTVHENCSLPDLPHLWFSRQLSKKRAFVSWLQGLILDVVRHPVVSPFQPIIQVRISVHYFHYQLP